MPSVGEGDGKAEIELTLQTGLSPGETVVLVTPRYEIELRGLLAEAQVPHGSSRQFADTILAAIIVALSGPAAWKAFASVIVAFLDRNKNKRTKVNIDEKTIDMAGYSADEVERLIELLARQHQVESSTAPTAGGDEDS